MSYQDTEFDRRLGNLVRLGAVAAVDLVGHAVQVDIGTADEPQLTDFLPWMTRRAGRTRTWSPPDVGEQVVVLSPGGELAMGVVLPGALFQDAFPPNGTAGSLERTTFPDGSVVEYDATAHQLLVNVGTGKVLVICNQATVQAAGSVTLDTPSTHCTGDLVVDGQATVKKQLTGQGGMAVSGGSGASVAGNMTITGGDVKADTISLKGHHHQEHDGPNTGSALA